MKRIERHGHLETALRLRAFAERVFREGVATLRAESNPADILRGAIEVGELLRAIDGYEGGSRTQFALRLIPHVFLRSVELRQGNREEIDLAEKVWRLPAERTEMKLTHVVPLSRRDSLCRNT